MNKTVQVIKYDLSYFLRLILIVYAWMLGLFVLLPTTIHLIGSGTKGVLNTVSISFSIASTGAVLVNAALLFYFGFLTYERFSFLIQNGISRRTGWAAKVVSLSIISLIATVYDFIISMFSLLDGDGYDAIPYLSLYGHFFRSQIPNMVMMVIVTFIFMLTVAIIGMVVGSFFSLLTRRHQKGALITAPIIVILLFTVLSRAIRSKLISFTAIENFLKFLIGYSKTMGNFNPFVPSMIMVVLIIISLIISRGLNTKLKIKRGE